MKLRYAILIVIALAMFYGVLERESSLVEDALRKDPPRRAELRACDATIQDGTLMQMSAERCYFRGK